MRSEANRPKAEGLRDKSIGPRSAQLVTVQRVTTGSGNTSNKRAHLLLLRGVQRACEGGGEKTPAAVRPLGLAALPALALALAALRRRPNVMRIMQSKVRVGIT